MRLLPIRKKRKKTAKKKPNIGFKMLDRYRCFGRSRKKKRR